MLVLAFKAACQFPQLHLNFGQLLELAFELDSANRFTRFEIPKVEIVTGRTQGKAQQVYAHHGQYFLPPLGTLFVKRVVGSVEVYLVLLNFYR